MQDNVNFVNPFNFSLTYHTNCYKRKPCLKSFSKFSGNLKDNIVKPHYNISVANFERVLFYNVGHIYKT